MKSLGLYQMLAGVPTASHWCHCIGGLLIPGKAKQFAEALGWWWVAVATGGKCHWRATKVSTHSLFSVEQPLLALPTDMVDSTLQSWHPRLLHLSSNVTPGRPKTHSTSNKAQGTRHKQEDTPSITQSLCNTPLPYLWAPYKGLPSSGKKEKPVSVENERG